MRGAEAWFWTIDESYIIRLITEGGARLSISAADEAQGTPENDCISSRIRFFFRFRTSHGSKRPTATIGSDSFPVRTTAQQNLKQVDFRYLAVIVDSKLHLYAKPR